MNTLPESAQCCPPCCDTETVAVPGPQGDPGAACTPCEDGINAFSITGASFTMPAEGADSASLLVDDSRWMSPTQIVYMTGIGWLQVRSKADATHVVLRNIEVTATGRYSDNVAPGTVAPSGQTLSPGGLQGNNGTNGSNGTNGTNGQNAYTTTAANFTQPAEGATVNVQVASSSWIASGQHLYITGGGDYAVTAIPDSTHVTVRNLEDTASGLYPGNSAPATVINSGAAVSPGGLQGPTGATPSGAQNVVAFTDEQSPGNAPAAMVFGAWTQKVLNTEYDPDSVATLVANQFTLPEGRWAVNGAFCADKCKIRLRLWDVTNNVLRLLTVNNVNSTTGVSIMFGAIEVPAGSPVMEIEYYAVDNGGGVFGVSTTVPGFNEAYSSIFFTRVDFP